MLSLISMSLQAFISFLDENPEIASKVAACPTFDDVAIIANQNGFDVTGAELTKHAAESTAELSDEALEAVAGGSWTSTPSGDAKATTATIGISASVTSAIIVK
jgi:predicted ribosomally synthesized peptide with nif11-like leader